MARNLGPRLASVAVTIPLVRPPRWARRFFPLGWKIRGVLRKLEFLRREVTVTTGVDLALASIGRHPARRARMTFLHSGRGGGKLARCQVCRPIVARGAARCNGPVIRGRLLIAGFGGRHSCETSAGIPSQWQRFLPHLDQIPGRLGRTAYGVCCNNDGQLITCAVRK